MATLNLGRIKPVFRGAYNNGTAYVVDDIVTSGGSSYICIQASTGNAVSNATYWTLMAEGGDVASTLTTQGDILYRDGSGLQRLGAGTSGQALITGGTGANPSWGTITSGTYSIHRIDSYGYATDVSGSYGSDNYIDIAGGNTVNFTPTSTDDYVFFSHFCRLNWGNAPMGGDVYINMGTSSTLGSSDTKLNYNGQHALYTNQLSDQYFMIQKSIIIPCTSLTVGTTYYAEQAGATHTASNAMSFNGSATGGAGYISGMNRHFVMMIHYKKN